MSKQYIYSRVSTSNQDTENQLVHLTRQFPNAEIVEETASGAKSRPALDGLVHKLTKGDELIVGSLDRLGRKTTEILVLIEQLEKRGVILKSLREGVDYSTISGRLVTQILVSVSELERAIISQRTKSALAAKREKGIVGGRPRKFDKAKVDLVRRLRSQGKTLKDISNQTGISVARIHQLIS